MVTDSLLHQQSSSSHLYTIPNGNGNGNGECGMSSNPNQSSSQDPDQPIDPKVEFLSTCRAVSKVLASMQMVFFILCMSVRFLNEGIRYTYICNKSDIRLVEGTGLISLILGMILFAGAHWEKTLCLVVWLIANGLGEAALLFRMCLGLVIGGLTTFYVILIMFTLGMLAISLRIVFLYRKELIIQENETNPKVTFVAYSRTNNI